MDKLKNCEHNELIHRITERETSEKIAVSSTTRETLQRLGISPKTLPQKCRNLLKEAAEYQSAIETQSLDCVTFCIQLTDVSLRQMQDEDEILSLRQKEDTLEDRIKRNKEEIEQWREELRLARRDMEKQDPRPTTVVEEIQVMKQKVASYEQSCEKTKSKFSSLNVPSELLPASLEALIGRLETLRAEEAELKDKADHILLARSAKQKLLQLKAAKF